MSISIFEKMKNVHLLVVGDVGIDEYLDGEVLRISPEAPVPIIEIHSQTLRLGLAANVAQNTCKLGAKTTLISISGIDSDATILKQMTKEMCINHLCLIEDSSRPTIRKSRVLSKQQHVLRMDYEKNHDLSLPIAERVFEEICSFLPSVDGIILEDYGKGLFTSEVAKFIPYAKQLGKPIFVDPSRHTPLNRYFGTTVLTPNVSEALSLCEISNVKSKSAENDDLLLYKLAKQILDQTQCESCVITCGAAGMVCLSQSDKNLIRIPTFAREVIDVTGAGDTVISVIALMRLIGQPLRHSLEVANAAAGIVVSRRGTSSVSSDDLKDELERLAATELLKARAPVKPSAVIPTPSLVSEPVESLSVSKSTEKTLES